MQRRTGGDTERRRFRGDEGYYIALTAILLLPLLAVTGFATDLGAWQARAASMQRAADAAALAGVAKLPDQGAAISTARDIATRNGFTDSADIDVTITPMGQRLRVEIAERDVDQYFSSVFRDGVNLSRGATAEYVLPVSLGSARNFLGTSNLANSSVTGNFSVGTSGSSAARENFWLSVNGPCSSAEQGDLLLPISTGNFDGGFDCLGGTVTDRRGGADPYYDATGYFYAVKVPTGYPGGAIRVQLFDAARCNHSSTENQDTGTFTTRFELRDWDTTPWDPKDNTTVLSSRELASRTNCGGGGGSSDCSNGTTPSGTTSSVRWAGRWCTLGTISSPVPGAIYFVRVNTFTPGGDSASTSQQFINNFSIRAARNSSGFTACTTDPYDPEFSAAANTDATRAACPQVYAANYLSIIADVVATPVFYLANIQPEHSNKSMTVSLFDAGEGMRSMELLNPRYTYNPGASPVTFDWEVIRQSGSDATPTGGWSGSTNILDTRGNGGACGTDNAQRGPHRTSRQKYNDRLVQLTYELPENIQTEYNGRTWWRVRYTTLGSGCSVQDRTTWGVTISGDPVRLVE
jgi:hypothetical protein